MIARALIAGTVLLAGAAAAGDDMRRAGLCEASAAALLPDGRLVVASDEMDQLAVYGREGTVPVWSKDVGKVDDIEGAARIGDTIFWITSHGFADKKKKRKRRRKLFATRAGADGLPVEVGKKFDDLTEWLADTLDAHSVALDGDLEDRLDIEGLAATDDGALLVGLRAPLATNGDALLVQVPRPFALLRLDQPRAATGQPDVFTLDLGGRGIRGIDRDPAGTFVIVAGKSKGGDKSFKLYTWRPGGQPRQVPGADLSGLQPEAVVIRKPGLAEVLSDEADGCAGSDKDGPPGGDRSFRSRMIRY